MPEGSYVRTIADFHLLPGVAEAIARLNRAGIRVIVVSNQRGIALGFYTADVVDSIHEHLQAELSRVHAWIDAFFYCPHDKNSCDCRKPLPGLYEQASAKFTDITPGSSAMIGDSLSDIEFGRAVGMKTVWIAGPKEIRTSPLWGLRAQSSFLHDGRAATIEQAILMHDGEAAGSREMFLKNLSRTQQLELLKCEVETLRGKLAKLIEERDTASPDKTDRQSA